MQKLLLFFFSIVFYFSTFSQKNSGFYGAKFYASADILLNTPLINIIVNSDFSQKVNYGYRMSAGYIMKRNFAFCFEGGFSNSSIFLGNHNQYNPFFLNVPEKIDYYGDTQYKKIYTATIEKLDIQTVSFMPKIEIATKNALLPLGLSHQIGIGFSNSKVINNNYKATIVKEYDNENYILSDEYLQTRIYNFDDVSPMKMINFMYALSMRKALTKNILLNYGLRYTLNIGINPKYDYYEAEIQNEISSEEFFISNNFVKGEVYSQKICNVISLNLGLTYAF